MPKTLFEPSEINGMELQNRFVRSATWEGLATDDGSCTPPLIDMMKALAKGGVGLIISSQKSRGQPKRSGPSNSSSRNPYLNGISYAGNRLHASWGWRESAGGSEFNHDLNYAYSDDHGRTWRNSAGTRIGTSTSCTGLRPVRKRHGHF